MIYKFSKPRRFITLFLCSLFSIFIIFVSCSFSFLKVNASVVSTIAEIAFEVLGKDYLEQKIGNFLDKVSDNVTSKQFVVDATSNLNSALMKAVLRAFGISFSSDYNENTFLANALPAGGLLSVPPNEYVDGDVSHNPKLYSELSEYVYDFLKTLTVRQLIDFCDGYNVGIDISPEVLNTISDVLKNHLDIFAYADDRVSNVINDFEDFENTDLSILYNLLSTCDTNSYNIVTCGKGYFCVMGKNYHNANFSYLGSSSSNTLYYFSLNGYIFRMGSNNGNDMDGYISRDFCYFRMNGLNDVCVRRYDKDGHRLSNGYSFSKKK